MKIDFEDKSYVELKKTEENNILLIISAKSKDNSLKRITNVVELNIDQLKKLLEDVI